MIDHSIQYLDDLDLAKQFRNFIFEFDCGAHPNDTSADLFILEVSFPSVCCPEIDCDVDFIHSEVLPSNRIV